MTDMERKTFCAALSRYGAQVQITMVFEEMAELQDVLCKFLRGRVDGDTPALNSNDPAADVMQEHMDRVMAQIIGGKQELRPFPERYHELRKVTYSRR